jgi:transcriptional regulator with XRE-family HTH domain
MERHYSSSFGDLLRLFRKRKGLSQQELAESLQVHRNTIGLWERGDRLPDTKGTVLEIAQRLALGDDEILQLLESSLTALAPRWCVPYQRNPFFTGRDHVLEEIHTRLQVERAHTAGLSLCLLSGLGGIGKTQTALEYTYRHLYDYSAIFWISADSQETLITSCTAIVEQWPYMKQLTQDQKQLVAVVKLWLREHRGWLLVLDNVEDPALIQEFLTTVHNGAILLTSRHPSLGGRTPIIVLQQMWAEEGALLLLRRAHYLTDPASDDHASTRNFQLASRIASAMDGLPLALDQAGAYIEETQCSLADFLELLQQYSTALLDERDNHADHPFSVTKTFTLAFEQLNREHPAAATLLTLCCFFAPEQIPEESICQGAGYLEPPLAEMVADALQFNAALRCLLAYSLIQRNPAAKTLSMHRLVQMVLRQHLDMQTRGYLVRQALRLISASILATPDRMWTACELLWPHAFTILHYLEEVQGTEVWDANAAAEVAALQIKLAGYLATRGRYVQAAALYQRSSHLSELYPTSMQPEFTRSLLYLANFYTQQNKYFEAQPLYERALSIQEQALGSHHPEVIATVISLALLHSKQEHYERAIMLLRSVVTRQAAAWSTDLAFQALLQDYLASLYARKADYEEAEIHFQRALDLWQRAQTSSHHVRESRKGMLVVGPGWHN